MLQQTANDEEKDGFYEQGILDKIPSYDMNWIGLGGHGLRVKNRTMKKKITGSLQQPQSWTKLIPAS